MRPGFWISLLGVGSPGGGRRFGVMKVTADLAKLRTKGGASRGTFRKA